jgi:hypothetical protein
MFPLGPIFFYLPSMLRELRLKSSGVIYFFLRLLKNRKKMQGVQRHYHNDSLRNLYDKGHPIIRHEGTEVEQKHSSTHSNIHTRWVGWSPPRPAALPPVPIIVMARWASGLAWTGTENRKPLSRTGVRTPDHAAHSESLYCLRCPGSYVICAYH